jgi:toxin ParE1/3/4
MRHSKRLSDRPECAVETYDIRFNQRATDDLIALRQWIEERTDDDFARAYLAKIKERCARLSHFPEQGAVREALGLDVRTISFERRLIIVYRVEPGLVTVLAVFNGAQESRMTPY